MKVIWFYHWLFTLVCSRICRFCRLICRICRLFCTFCRVCKFCRLICKFCRLCNIDEAGISYLFEGQACYIASNYGQQWQKWAQTSCKEALECSGLQTHGSQRQETTMCIVLLKNDVLPYIWMFHVHSLAGCFPRFPCLYRFWHDCNIVLTE